MDEHTVDIRLYLNLCCYFSRVLDLPLRIVNDSEEKNGLSCVKVVYIRVISCVILPCFQCTISGCQITVESSSTSSQTCGKASQT